MSISISDGQTTINLPRDLQWTDQFSWSAVEQSAEYSLTGALVVQQGVKQAGRPFTLASNGGVWVYKPDVEALYALYNQTSTLTLTINGTSYPFQFERPGGLKVSEVRRLAIGEQDQTHRYTIEIKGFEVAA
ncbi:MAG: hypothetical protein HLX50_09070 [Alteromonadaceae bacterium]|nr:hypothetical protein [Alteromonadaceae bacterium]